MLNHDQEISGKTYRHQVHSARALRLVAVAVAVVAVVVVVAVVAVAVVVAPQVAEIRKPPSLGWREPPGDSAGE